MARPEIVWRAICLSAEDRGSPVRVISLLLSQSQQKDERDNMKMRMSMSRGEEAVRVGPVSGNCMGAGTCACQEGEGKIHVCVMSGTFR